MAQNNMKQIYYLIIPDIIVQRNDSAVINGICEAKSKRENEYLRNDRGVFCCFYKIFQLINIFYDRIKILYLSRSIFREVSVT